MDDARNIEIIKKRLFHYMTLLMNMDPSLMLDVFPEFVNASPQPKTIDETLELLSRAEAAYRLFTTEITVDKLLYSDKL
jgi:hypothetical protein